MTIKEKQELVRLLHIYKQEQFDLSRDNLDEVKRIKEEGRSSYEADIEFGVKAQYNHARIISNKLEKEIGTEINSYWNNIYN